MLAVSKIVPLAASHGKIFSEEVAQVMHAAESLYDGWNHLADLAEKNGVDDEESNSSKMEMNQKA